MNSYATWAPETPAKTAAPDAHDPGPPWRKIWAVEADASGGRPR